MDKTMLHNGVPYVLCLILVVASVSAIMLGVISDGRRSSDTYLRFYPRGLVGCVVECTVRRRCQAITYHYGYQYCELAYTTNTRPDTAGFLVSDIHTWDNALAGRCANHGCSLDKTCDMRTGACIIKDCGAPPEDVDPYAVLYPGGHHEVGNGVMYRCYKSFMYNLTGHVPSNTYVIGCTYNGQWEKANFFCRRWHSELLKFCPRDHTYEPVTRTCYMTHNETKTRNEAEQYCGSHNGHLLSVHVQATLWNTTWAKFAFTGSAARVLLDGRHCAGSWYDWAGQNLFYRALLEPAPQAEHDCVLINVTDLTLEAVSCSQHFYFSCQFELCPTTAGYQVSRHDVCYKVMPESQFRDIGCMENVTSPAMRDFYRSAVMDFRHYDDVGWYPRKHDRLYSQLFRKHGNYAFFYENDTISNYLGANARCFTKVLGVGVSSTEKLKHRLLHILRNQTSVLLVGMMLDKSTYKWAPIKGSAPDSRLLYFPEFTQRSTDTNRCLVIHAKMTKVYLRNDHCEKQLMFICAVMAGTKAQVIMCESKSMYKDAPTTLTFRSTVINGQDFAKWSLTQKMFYTSHYLVDKEYTYRWTLGPVGLVKEHDLNFRSNYTNDTKDALQQVIYYPDTDTYGLAGWNSDQYNFICQSEYDDLSTRESDISRGRRKREISFSRVDKSSYSPENRSITALLYDTPPTLIIT